MVILLGAFLADDPLASSTIEPFATKIGVSAWVMSEGISILSRAG